MIYSDFNGKKIFGTWNGGQLAKLIDDATAKLKAARPSEDVPAWAFRFLQSFPSVKVTLSGMSNMEQLVANIKTYEENKPLNDSEMKLIPGIADDMISKKTVPCTGCHYSVFKCPKQLDIPELIKFYNESLISGSGVFIAPMALVAIDKDKQPECCIGCKSCEKVCPQTIHISEELKKFAKKMGRY